MFKQIMGIGSLLVAAVVVLAPAAQATPAGTHQPAVAQALSGDLQPAGVPVYGGTYPSLALCQKAGRATSFPFHCHETLGVWHLIYYVY